MISMTILLLFLPVFIIMIINEYAKQRLLFTIKSVKMYNEFLQDFYFQSFLCTYLSMVRLFVLSPLSWVAPGNCPCARRDCVPGCK